MADEDTNADFEAAAEAPDESNDLHLPTPSEMPSPLMPSTRSTERVLLRALPVLFLVLLAVVTLLPFVGQTTDGSGGSGLVSSRAEFIGLLLGVLVFGVLVVVFDSFTPNKRLSALFGVYLGIVAGLLGALAFGAVIDLIAGSWDLGGDKELAYIKFIKYAVGIALCYLAVSVVLNTKDDFRLVIPYVEFSKQIRGVRPMLLDTSALIDGRIEGLGQTGFLAAPLVVSHFVVDELQLLADSGDKLKRARGRRGLNMISKLQANPYVDLTIDNSDVSGGSVDHMLLEVAADQGMRVLTTDYNLEKVANIRNVAVLNLNEMASALKPQVIPGETLKIEIVKRGESPGQGVGYMPDGTMVVVEEAADRVGEDLILIVTNSLQTSAGRMIFGRASDSRGGADGSADGATEPATSQMAHRATNQPRDTGGAAGAAHRSSGRRQR